MRIINICDDRAPEIRMKINVADDVIIVYTFLPKIKYNMAIDLLEKLNFKHIKNEKIGETTKEYYQRIKDGN